MALGIACAGTGLREAITLLEPMILFDPINFVRQGALIASAMIMIQQTEQTCPKVNFFRQSYAEVISNKHDDQMAKYGAILAQGKYNIHIIKLLLVKSYDFRYHRCWRKKCNTMFTISYRPYQYVSGCWMPCIHPILVLVPIGTLPCTCLYTNMCDWA